MAFRIENTLKKQMILFILVGILNSIFGYLVFALFIYLGLHYTLASLFATIIGVLFNFKTTGTIVFNNKNNSLIIRYFAMYGFIYLLNISFLKLCSLINPNMYINGAIAVVIMAGVSFLLNKFFVFPETRYETN